jgi:hypothetical protein
LAELLSFVIVSINEEIGLGSSASTDDDELSMDEIDEEEGDARQGRAARVWESEAEGGSPPDPAVPDADSPEGDENEEVEDDDPALVQDITLPCQAGYEGSMLVYGEAVQVQKGPTVTVRGGEVTKGGLEIGKDVAVDTPTGFPLLGGSPHPEDLEMAALATEEGLAMKYRHNMALLR